MGPEHDLLPRLIDLVEPLGFLGQLLGDVTAHEDGLQVDPHVLDKEPSLQDLVGVGQVLDPLLDLLSERRVVTVGQKRAEHHQAVFNLDGILMKKCFEFLALLS